MLRKTSKIIVELTGFIVAAVFVTIGVLMWILSQGPVNIGFANPYLSQMMNKISPNVRITIKDTELSWGGIGNPLTFIARDVHVNNLSGGEVTSVSEIGISLSFSNLLIGKLKPTRIMVFAPEIVATHLADGTFDMNFEQETQNTEGSFDALALLLNEMKKEPGNDSVTGQLNEISITGAKINFRDEMYGINLVSPQSDITIIRDEDGIEGIATLKVGLSDGQKTVRGEFVFDRALGTFQVSAAIIDVKPENFVDIAPEKLAILKNIDVPISLRAYMGLDGSFKPQYLDVIATGTNGIISTPDYFQNPVTVNDMKADFHYDAAKGIANLKSLVINFADFSLNAKSRVKINEKSGLVINASAVLNNVPTNLLKDYWPIPLAPNPRDWVTTRLSNGIIPKADIEVSITVPDNDFNKLKIDRLTGTIAINDVDVNYLPPMPPVKDVSGIAKFNATDFYITAQSGILDGITLSHGDIHISKLNEDLPDMAIDLDASGDMGKIMTLIDNDPLGFAKVMGFVPQNFSGIAQVKTHLEFPLLSDLLVDDVQVKTFAEVTEATAQKIILNKDLTKAKMSLSVDNKHMTVDGTGLFADIPVNFSWMESFDSKISPVRTLDVQAVFPVKKLANLDLTFLQPYSDGLAEANLKLNAPDEKNASMTIKGDLTQTKIDFKPLRYKKDVGKKAVVSFIIPLKEYTISTLDNLVYREGANEINGTVALTKDGNFQSLLFPHLKIGNSTASLAVEDWPEEKGLKINIKGAQFDAAPYLKDKEEENVSDGEIQEKKKDPDNNLLIRIDTESLLLSDKGGWQNAKGLIFIKHDENERIEMDAKAGNGDVYLRFVPENGIYSLKFETNDAGAALNPADILPANITNGILKVEGKTDINNPYHLTGIFDMRNFTVTDAPILARLLNAFSLTGVLELLNNDGISFSGAKGIFGHENDIISVKNANAYGSSIGFGIDGTVDNASNDVSMEGTIVPAYMINQLIGNIPIVGNILTGAKNEGVIAAKFTLKGKGKDAEVSVNPLSALTPGIFRSIFFDSEIKGDAPPPIEQPDSSASKP